MLKPESYQFFFLVLEQTSTKGAFSTFWFVLIKFCDLFQKTEHPSIIFVKNQLFTAQTFFLFIILFIDLIKIIPLIPVQLLYKCLIKIILFLIVLILLFWFYFDHQNNKEPGLINTLSTKHVTVMFLRESSLKHSTNQTRVLKCHAFRNERWCNKFCQRI